MARPSSGGTAATAEHLVGRSGQRVMVGAPVDSFPSICSGATIVQGAEELPGAGQPEAGQRLLAEPEVGQLDVVGLAAAARRVQRMCRADVACTRPNECAASSGIRNSQLIEHAEGRDRPGARGQKKVTAGCNPVRVIVTPDGKTAWVTVRESDALLAFDTAKMLSDPKHSLVARWTSAPTPSARTFAKDHTRIVAACSDWTRPCMVSRGSPSSTPRRRGR